MENKEAASFIENLITSVGLTPSSSDYNRFINVWAKEFPGQVFRVQDEKVRILSPIKGLNFSSSFGQLSKRKSYAIRLLNALKLAVQTHRTTDIGALLSDVLDWTTNPGKLSAAIKIETNSFLKSLRSSGVSFTRANGPLYRGLALTKEQFGSVLSGKTLKPRAYESFSAKEQTAIRFAKGRMIGLEKHADIGVLFQVLPKHKPKVVIDIPEFVQSNPSILHLAESGVFEGEPGTLYLDEVIVKQFALGKEHIFKVWDLKTGRRVKI